MSRSERLLSLDAFRGITIAAMILVNNPGTWNAVYAPLLHAKWNGWTPTDLIYPFFLFIIGVAMPFSFSKYEYSNQKNGLLIKVLRRSSVIFLLGIFLHLFPRFDFESLRIAGVLQRIAIVYLFASIIFLYVNRRNVKWAVVLILLGYWGLMTLVSVPGHGPGVLTPEANLAAWVDSLLLPGQMYQTTWDPEGILSTLPAIASTLIGVLCGLFLLSSVPRREVAAWLFVSGWALCILGIFWGSIFPINKAIWTSSYVLLTSGAALQFMGACQWLVDVKGYRKFFQPAIVFGVNSITVYVLSGMVASLMTTVRVGPELSLKNWVVQNVFMSWLDPMNASLAFALSYVILWYWLMRIFYRRRIFLKV